MAGLDDINPSDPAGSETPTLGDNRIRALAAKTIEAFDIEHALAGPHTILVGSSAQRPAAGYAGRIYILTAAGVAVELQYDTGSAWVFLTSNQTVIDYAAGLAVHIAASPIDHPNGSVTQIKIAQGAILKKHLDSSGDLTSIANLVNGGNADAFHEHASTDQNIALFTSSGTWTCPDGITLVLIEASGGGGGGGGRSTFGGSGGGGGGYVKGYGNTVPGTEYSVVIGLGGSGGIVDANGLAGGQTSLGGIIAYGGGGGKRGTAGTPTGIGGGFTVGGGFYGDNGNDGVDGGPFAGDGGPGGSGGGFGGVGGAKGVNGTIPGGGGGGGCTGSDTGGSGARGVGILRW